MVSFSLVDLAFIVCGLVGLLYYFSSWKFRDLDKIGIKYVMPLPFVGNMKDLALSRRHLDAIIGDNYNLFKNEKYFLMFHFNIPTVVIKDIELIKKITVKDFDNFMDHTPFTSEDDKLFFHNLFSLRGEKWHQMRTTLSPAFTGSKMKEMMPFMEECATRLVQYLDKNMENPEAKNLGYIDLELKDLVSRCTNDAISSCAFGIQTDSLNEPKNQFFLASQNMTQLTGLQMVMALMPLIVPISKKLFSTKLLSSEVEQFYKTIVLDIIKSRNETGVVRRDMIQLLMQAMKGTLQEEEGVNKQHDDVGFATVHETNAHKTSSKKSWTDEEIVAQAVIFVFAGFETISTLLSFLCYELARNPDKQKLLRKEVDDYIAENGTMVTYNDLRDLAYMDMVVTETLRLWPPVGTLDRLVVKDYTLPPPNANSDVFELKKNNFVWIPVLSIHKDPQHYSDPDKFIPERFSEENRSNIKPFTYMPFGAGPRNCIGNRFALMEVKILMFHLLSKYKIIKTPKTQDKIEIKSNIFLLQPKGGIWLGLEKRS